MRNSVLRLDPPNIWPQSPYILGMKESEKLGTSIAIRKPYYRVFTCPSLCKARVVRVCSCNDFVRCKFCGGKRGRKNRARIISRLRLMDAHKKKSESLKLLTLTIARTHQGLKADVESLTRAFEAFRRRVAWKRRVSHWIGVKEITKGNVHLHVVILSSYWEQSSISREWRELTGNYIVDIRKLDLAKALQSLSSYLVKGSDPELIEEVAEMRDNNKKMRFLIASRTKLPSLLVIEAIVRHTDCPECNGKMGYALKFKRFEDAENWLKKKKEKFLK